MMMEPILCAWLSREANLQPHPAVEYNIQLHLTGKPDQSYLGNHAAQSTAELDRVSSQ